MNSIESPTPQELKEKLSGIILLRASEVSFRFLNASLILIEAMLKDIPKIGMEWFFTSAPIDLYTAMYRGIKNGVFIATNERLVFLKRTMVRKGVTIWWSHHYEVEKSVDLKDIISLKVKEDILEVIYRDGADVDVLHFAGFYEIDPKQPGYESFPKTVGTNDVADTITEFRRVSQ